MGAQHPQFSLCVLDPEQHIMFEVEQYMMLRLGRPTGVESILFCCRVFLKILYQIFNLPDRGALSQSKVYQRLGPKLNVRFILLILPLFYSGIKSPKFSLDF